MPILFPETFFIITGEGTWKRETPIPEVSNNTIRTTTLGAIPIKLIQTTVIAGATISRYLIGSLSAAYPTNGFRSDGSLCTIVKKLAKDKEIENLSINNGSNGARNEE